MKKTKFYTTAIALLFGYNALLAQAPIPNNGFENWSTAAQPNPTSWGNLDDAFLTSGLLTGFNKDQITKEVNPGDVYSGSYSIKIRTDSVDASAFGAGKFPVPGFISLGTLSLDLSGIGGGGTGGGLNNLLKLAGYAYTDRPDSFSIAYKYSPASPADTGLVSVTLTSNTPLNGRVTVGNVIIRATAQASYVVGKVKINYQSALTPDTLLIQVASGSSQSAAGGTTIWADDLQFYGLDTTFKAYLNPKGALNACTGDTVRLRTDNIVGNTYEWYNGASVLLGATTNKLETTAAGVYYVRVTTPNGTYTSDTATVVVNQTPTVTLSGNQDSICKNAAAITLTGGSPAGGQFSGGAAVTAGKFTPSAAANGANVVRYTYQDPNGCRASATESIFVKTCVNDIEVLQADVRLTMFPNPASTQLSVRGDEKMIGGEMIVVDITGRLVTKEKITNTNFSLDVKNFPTGFYAVRFTNANNEVLANGKFTVAK
jgi:hypothetical protein